MSINEDIVDLTLVWPNFFLIFYVRVRATSKLGRKTLSAHRHVIYQSNRKESLYLTGHSSGVLDSFNTELELKAERDWVWAKKC